jgi:hypothetical protein
MLLWNQANSWQESPLKTEVNDGQEQRAGTVNRLRMNSPLNALTASPDFSRVAFATREGRFSLLLFFSLSSSFLSSAIQNSEFTKM